MDVSSTAILEGSEEEPHSNAETGESLQNMDPSKVKGEFNITLLEHLLESRIVDLQDRVLIGNFGGFSPPISELSFWANKNWKGLKEVFFFYHGSIFFIPIFSSKESRDKIYKFKGGFCKGFGFYTLEWSPNFNPWIVDIRYEPF